MASWILSGAAIVLSIFIALVAVKNTEVAGLNTEICDCRNETPEGGFSFDCNEHGNVKNYYHPYNCTRFVSCSNGHPYEIDCPVGLHYHLPNDRCEWPDIAGCKCSCAAEQP